MSTPTGGTNTYPLGPSVTVGVNINGYGGSGGTGGYLLSNAIWTAVNVSGATTASLVSPVPGSAIKVLQLYIVCSANDTINLQSSVTTSVADGPQSFIANGGAVLNFSPAGWFTTVSGEGLNLVTTGGTAGGNLTYVLV